MSSQGRSAPLSPVAAAEARAHMVEHQLRRRGVSDERVLEAMGRVPAGALPPEDLRRFRVRGRRIPDRLRPDDLAAVHRRDHLSAARSVGRRAGPRRRHGLGLPGGAGRARGRGGDDRARSRARRPGHGSARGGRARAGRGARRGRLARGAPERSPFDAIAVAAAAPGVPPALYAQLSVGGRLVLPRGSRWGQELVLVSKSPRGPVERASVPCRFVPLVGAEGFGRG